MGLFSFLSRKADPPKVSDIRAVAFLDAFNAQGSGLVQAPKNLQDLSEKGYEANVTVFSCINEIARAIASLHWNIVTGEGEDEKPVKNHPLNALFYKANEAMSWRDFSFSHMAYLLLTGEGYGYAVSSGEPNQPARGKMAGAYSIPPSYISPIKSGILGEASGFLYGPQENNAQNTSVYHPSRVMYQKLWNPRDPLRGMSPLRPAWRPLTSDNKAADWNISLLENGGKLSGILMVQGGLTSDQRNALKEQMKSTSSGKNVGKTLVLEAEKAEWKETSATPTELDWMNGRKLSRLEICQAFQVPPELIGDQEHKTYSNYQEARKAFWVDTVLPYADQLADALTNWMKPFMAADQRICYDRNKIDALQEDQDKLWTRGLDAMTKGAITANEFRAMVGMKPATDKLADMRMVQSTMTTAEDLLDSIENPEPVPAALADGGDTPGPQAPATQAEEDAQAEGEKALAELEPELKLLNLSGDMEALWKKLNARYEAWVKATRPKFKRLLDQDLEAASEAVRGAPDVAFAQSLAENAIIQRTDEWHRTMKRAYRMVGLDYAKATDRGMKSDLGALEFKADEQGRQRIWETAVEDYWNKHGLMKVTDITAYTRSKLRKQLREGLEAGESISQLTQRIEGMKSVDYLRAERIARTEVLAAGNNGSLEAAKAFGVPMTKSWLTTKDSRTRGTAADDPFSHLEPDGQTVKLDEAFIVGGEPLQFPGDSSAASAGNIINCRCTLLYNTSL